MDEVIRQAATVVVIRSHIESGLQVYMIKRPETMKFLAGFYVFPGGGMDKEDSKIPVQVRNTDEVEGLTPAHWVTAIRECFEEVGVLLANQQKNFSNDYLAKIREDLMEKKIRFDEWVVDEGITLDTRHMRYIGNRLTPKAVSKMRFDTRFFIAILPNGSEPIPCTREVAEAIWVSPKEALARWEQAEWNMVPPTVDCLRSLASFQTAEAAFENAYGVGSPTDFEKA